MLSNKKWYQKTWIMVLFGIFLPPVGIILALINPRYSTRAKSITSGILILWLIVLIASSGEGTKEPIKIKRRFQASKLLN